MKNQYFISGLGANEKAFDKLSDFGTNKIMVKWIDNKENESLKSYCERIISKYNIKHTDLIVGLSFGGLIAQQIAEILKLDSVILISSFRTKNDLKFMIREALNYKLFNYIPELKTALISGPLASFINSNSTTGKSTLKEMIEATDVKLMKWSIEKIFEQNEVIAPTRVKYNLIGTEDRIVKSWRNNWTYEIKGGSHFMVYEKANEVSNIIKQIVKVENE